jgi:hypothetical protein
LNTIAQTDTRLSGIQAYQICRYGGVSLKLYAPFYYCNIVLIALTSDPRDDDFFHQLLLRLDMEYNDLKKKVTRGEDPSLVIGFFH